MMIKSKAVIGAIAVLIVSAVSHSALGTSEDIEEFRFSADCAVGLFFVPGDADAVQAFLPAGYTALGDPITRRATLIVEAGSCSNASIDGSAADPFLFGEILALVGPPGHEAGSVYDFGAPTSSPGLAARWNRLGLSPLHLLTKAMAVELEEGPTSSLVADVPWSFSPYSFTIQVADQQFVNPDPNDRCCAWTEGSRGTVGTRFRLSHDGEPGELDAAGEGTLRAEADSPLGLMMGSETFTGSGFIRRFHFDAIVTLFG